MGFSEEEDDDGGEGNNGTIDTAEKVDHIEWDSPQATNKESEFMEPEKWTLKISRSWSSWIMLERES
ncbi:uncharacterized protein Z518_02128 [Rhinocladiella mackenziei CBS 650.93]|uniref:Uncharacterized protein n=1 Tax=Rhinocladiella mackenziei CBS 650.93 TaxID=1442369 RepID=A0A0D2JE82_9EURO|nr:uncharacterized protein Z518_02128 [Rhinocladiella mackenziei CBS 650.93]KIX07475.1 hypothetical protein Z518_02128 [Rhinocladiella mackenziei CBS 650.93]